MSDVSAAHIDDVLVGPGHDGRAEVVLVIAYPNGAKSRMSLDEEAVEHVLALTNVESPDALRGRSWEALAPALSGSAGATHGPGRGRTSPRSSTEEER